MNIYFIFNYLSLKILKVISNINLTSNKPDESTYKQSYCTSANEINHNTGANFRLANRSRRHQPSGALPQRLNMSTQISTLLMGEQYMDFKDPQKNSFVQRAWVYGQDSTLGRVEQKLNQTLKNLGGAGSRHLVMSNIANERSINHVKGDLHNSLPFECNFFFNFKKKSHFFKINLLKAGEKQFFPAVNFTGAFRIISSKITDARHRSFLRK